MCVCVCVCVCEHLSSANMRRFYVHRKYFIYMHIKWLFL